MPRSSPRSMPWPGGLALWAALCLALAACRLPPGAVTVLAGDVPIHLGDEVSPPPGWVALYNQHIPSPVWVSTFYLTSTEGLGELSVLVQAGREPTSEIVLNGRPLDPRFMTPADPADPLAWRVVTGTIAAGTLQPGPNEILIRAGLHPPFRQRAGDLWDDFQFRSIVIHPVDPRRPRPAASPAPSPAAGGASGGAR